MKFSKPNPIRVLRKQQGLTLGEMADRCGFHLQSLFLNEHGVYPTVLPRVVRYLEETLDLDASELQSDYQSWQYEKRRFWGERLGLETYELGPPILSRHPFVQFRQDLDSKMSRMMFCKRFCVHPASVYKLEIGVALKLAEQIEDALQDAGLSDTVIGELNSRSEEFANGQWKQAV